jgi:hypothetical protein
MSALLTLIESTCTDVLPTLPWSCATAGEYGTAAVVGSLSGSEFQLSTIALLPLNVMVSFATKPLAK